MDIEDIATREFSEVDVDERLGKVRSLFEREYLTEVIVTDDGDYAGIITRRQLLQSHIEDDTKAAAMVQSAPKVRRHDDVRDVARMLVEGGVKLAPVFEGESLWGIVTTDAILESVLDNLDVLTVDEILSEDVVSVTEDATVGKLINAMRENGISRLPVRNENGYLSGIVTTRDIVDVVVRDMDKATRGERAGDLDRVLDISVHDVMSSPVETVPLGTSVRDAVETLFDRDIAGLVVTPEGDRTIAGILTKTDVLRALTYTEREHLDVQITNIDVLETLTREDIRSSIETAADKYREMQVHHAHIRFNQHKEKLRGTPLIYCQIRLRTNVGQVAGTGEGYGAESAFRVALDKLERNVIELKGIQADEAYEGQLLRKLGEL